MQTIKWIKNKYIELLTFIFFSGASFLILTEQFKRLGLPILISILLSLSLVCIPIYLYKKADSKKYTSLIKPKRHNKRTSVIGLFLIVISLGFVFYPVFFAHLSFEISYDSLNYHIPIIKSLATYDTNYNLNDNISTYSVTFPRAAEAMIAIVYRIFPTLTTLQAEAILLYILFLIAYFIWKEIIHPIRAAIMIISILAIPTIFMQALTNYVDVFIAPITLIAIGILLVANTDKRMLIAFMWIGLLGGIKFPLLAICVLIVILYLFLVKKLNFRNLFLGAFILGLPVVLLLFANIIKGNSPVAPYSFLFFPGMDISKTNFIRNRPIEFTERPYLNTDFERCVYSHIRHPFKAIQSYDARIGGGGIIFLLYIIFFLSVLLVLSLSLIYKKSNHKKIEWTKYKVHLFLLLITFASLIITPETYWFRYIVFTAIIIIMYVMQRIDDLKHLNLSLIFTVSILVISTFNFYYLRYSLVKFIGYQPNINNLLTITHHKLDESHELVTLKEQINNKQITKVTIATEPSYPEGAMAGNYLNLFKSNVEINYINLNNLDLKSLRVNKDEIMIIAKNNIQKNTDDYFVPGTEQILVKSDVEDDAILYIPN